MTGGIKVSAYSELMQYIDTISIINTHCHKLPQKQGFPASIKDLIEHSYLGWCHKEWDGTKEKATNFIRSLRHNSYFFWIEKSLQTIFNTQKRFDEENYPWFDEKIKELSQKVSSDNGFLRSVCHYDKIILDGYWNPGTDLGDSDLFTPTFRINQFLFGYQIDTVDDNGNNPFLNYNWPKDLDFKGYLGKIEEKIVEKKEAGCVALKSSLPYDRSICFKERTYEEAEKGYQNPNAKCK